MAVASSSNPITSVPLPSSSPITSVPESMSAYPPSYYAQPTNQQLVNKLHLDLRGESFIVDRETLMSLPESVLLCLFPNGLVLSRPMGGGWGDDGLGGGDDEENVYAVDYDPESFRHILTFWHTAQQNFYGDPTTSPPIPSLYLAQQQLLTNSSTSSQTTSSLSSQGIPDLNIAGTGENPLITKQPIIVLREELEYFSIPPPSSDKTNHPLAGKFPTVLPKGIPTPELQRLKFECGKGLLERKKIFTALQRNVSKEGNLAEQHLIDMLCMSGFSRDDTWSYRALEPSRCCISSIALVLLKTGIQHQQPTKAQLAAGQLLGNVAVDSGQMGTAQKLLLFWRKPARKCWWDGVDIDIPVSEKSEETAKIKVWARRVWTLELSLI